ncbi:MAG: gamma-glutamylcyclotransferase [Pseudomonadota bacterium]
MRANISGAAERTPAIDPMPPVEYFVDEGSELWVFGYGSLMWKPGFDAVESCKARLYGYHRRFCIYSFRHRGTPSKPGLVLGLDRGGSCHGMAFRVAADNVREVTENLWRREMVSGVYRPIMTQIDLDGRRVLAGTFVADPRHRQYCAEHDPAILTELVAQGVGESGENPEYLFNTVARLDELGLRDRVLHDLAKRVRARLASG